MSLLTPGDVLNASASALFPFLTLILASIEEHETACVEFVNLARALRDRCAVHRVLKNRLVLMLEHASFPNWRLRIIVRRSVDVYAHARATLRATVHTTPHSHPAHRSRAAPLNPAPRTPDPRNGPNASRAFREAVATHVFADARWHPAVRGGADQHHVESTTEGDGVSFTRAEFVKAVSECPGVRGMADAERIVDELWKQGYINVAHHVDGLDERDPRKLFRSEFHDAVRDATAVHYADSNGAILSSATLRTEGAHHHSVVMLSMPADVCDLQSFSFWTFGIHNQQVEENNRLTVCSVAHPLLVMSVDRDGPVEHHDYKPAMAIEEQEAAQTTENVVVETVVVKKVFSSLSRPYLVQLERVVDGAKIDTLSSNQAESFCKVPPAMLIKKGDNLMQDHCVTVMFRVFNFIWRRSSRYAETDALPYCFSYEVVPTSVQQGFIECVSNVEPVGEMDWKIWYQKHAGDPSGSVITNLIYSAAGAIAGGYVLGATDRHWDNMVIRNNDTFLHIDFSFILGEVPPIDAPRISIPPDMENLLKSVKGQTASLWDVFVEATVKAYLALRSDAAVILRVSELLFTHAGFDRSRVHEFLTGKSGLALEKTDKDAAEYVRKKLLKSSHHWKTHLKRFVHDVVNPAWYSVVRDGPLPADSIMKLINRYQSENPTTQKLTQQEKLKSSDGSQHFNIG